MMTTSLLHCLLQSELYDCWHEYSYHEEILLWNVDTAYRCTTLWTFVLHAAVEIHA